MFGIMTQMYPNFLDRGKNNRAAGFFCNPILCLIFITLIVLTFSPDVQAVDKQHIGPTTPSSEVTEDLSSLEEQIRSFKDLHITAYTKAFAERFALEPPEPGTEPSGGLQAIELTVEKPVKWVDHYNCHFYLYVDSDLPIKFPESGVAGYKWMLISQTHFFARDRERWLKWPVEDRRYSTLLIGKYRMKAFLATMDYVPNKKGAIDSITYVEYHKDLLPGLTYIKLNVSMDLLLKNHKENVGVFLQKDSQIDYRSRVYIEPGNFIKLKLPDHLYKKHREWGMNTWEVNKMIEKERKRKEKEMQAGQK